jgi:tetratricopeptide (TPR) repeat protein
MTNNSSSWREQCQKTILKIVTDTLQGKIRSKSQVGRMLVEGLGTGMGEVFEICLTEEFDRVKEEIEKAKDELKQAKSERKKRALETIQSVWEESQKTKQQQAASNNAVQQIFNAASSERALTLLQILDLNTVKTLTKIQIQELANLLREELKNHGELELITEIQPLIDGLSRGVNSLTSLEDFLVSWMYEQSSTHLGFEGIPGQKGPWVVWAKQLNNPDLQALFKLQAQNQSAREWSSKIAKNLSIVIELVVLLNGLQQGLITWFDRQPYSVKWGKQLSSATLIAFLVIWSELANGFENNLTNCGELAKICFQMTLQILRAFARRDDFPLYGGIFASFSGETLRDSLAYLDRPLQDLGVVPEKGRILTLLGYSQRTLGRYDRAKEFHREALEIARTRGDIFCEIANLNHLSRLSIVERDYPQAIDFSQRALILAREQGDRLGEANALTNLGYSEILNAHQNDETEPDFYERYVEYLQLALTLSAKWDGLLATEDLRDRTQALAYNSLGIACIILEKPQLAIDYLNKGILSAGRVGESYLQGLNLFYLAEAYYKLPELNKAIYFACLAMYFLERIGAKEWRQAAGLVGILETKMNIESFQIILQQYRKDAIAVIGVDGFDYLGQLLEQYRISEQ